MNDRTRCFNQDCMEGMKEFPDKYFELAIVDPPYGIGDTWSKNRKDRFYKHGALHSYQNETAPAKEYFDELMRVSKNQIIWGGNYFTSELSATNAWIIWDKVRNAEATFMSEAELAWTSFAKVMRIFHGQWDGAKKCDGILDKVHPHQKPKKLYRWLLKNYAKEGDKILDTHLGSQSSRIAAFDMGFDFTGYELDKGYFEAGNKRFNQHKNQLKLSV